MAAPRFYTPVPLARESRGTLIDLAEPVAHHAARVLRLGPGDALTLFDGAGGEFDALLERVDKRGATARVERFQPIERESPLALTLAQAIAANDAMDFAVRKATELGVASIQPLVTARSAPLPAGDRGEKRLAHWRQIAVAACEQCGRNRIPDVAPPQALSEWIGGWTGSGIVFAPEATRSIATLEQPTLPLALLIGPEGGFEPREVAAARAKGFTPVAVGPRVLRTETAAIAALAVVQTLWGDLR